MKKRIFLLNLLAFLFAFPVLADYQQNALVVLTKNGAKTTFFLDEKPEVFFQGTDLVVKSVFQETSFALADVVRFTYEKIDNPDGIGDKPVKPTGVSYETDGSLIVSHVPEGASVDIYSLDGKLLHQLTPKTAGSYKLSLSSLSSGVYLVKVGNITSKITKP